METALNGVWDSGAGIGDNIVIIGAGIVGLLIAYLCARIPGTRVCVVDPQPNRATYAQALGVDFCAPDDVSGDADVVFHTSGTASGLANALTIAGFEATIVEMSWYGDKTVDVPLGRLFHSRRLKLIASQVGHVAASRRGRWSHKRRLDMALSLLDDDRLDVLLDHETAFEDLPLALPDIMAADARYLTSLVRY